jgi:hypothetical protein
VNSKLVVHHTYSLAWITVSLVLIVVVSRRWRFWEKVINNRKVAIALLIASFIFIGGIVTRLPEGLHKSTLLHGFGTEENALYQWARQTPLNSIFLIPPDLERFRLNAQRAIVVDAKSHPLDPEHFLEWYERIQEVTGIYDPPNFEHIADGYRDLNWERLKRIKSRFPFDYIVLTKGPSYDFIEHYRIAYENSKFLVLEVPSESERKRIPYQ